MSENRETPAVGAPVEEADAEAQRTETLRTEVLEAIERAKNANSSGATGSTSGGVAAEDRTEVEAVPEGSAEGATTDPASAADERHREEFSKVDTELDLDVPSPRPAPGSRIAATEEMPSAAASADPAAVEAEKGLPNLDGTPVRDGEIRISEDHPMAALYTQTPTPPDIRGNRGAGALIALLATVGFAVVYAGVIALSIAAEFPPSTFLDEGLLPRVMSLGFALACGGFLLAMLVLVLIVGRAGWWAYVLGGFLVGVAVWASAVLGYALHDRFVLGETVSLQPLSLIEEYGLLIPVLAAAIVAREATVWFGAWIGSRGRRMKLRNAEALAEYEEALTEVQAKPA